MNNQPLPAADVQRRIDLYREGYTFAQIGNICGVTESAVRYCLAKHGAGEYVPRPWRVVPAETRRRVVELYQAGYTWAQISRSQQVSTFFIRNELRRQGIPPRYPQKSAALRQRWAKWKRETE